VSDRPAPPPLPPDLPPDLRAFVSCATEEVELKGGKARWLPVPPVLKRGIGRFLTPSASIEPLDSGRTARLLVGWSRVGLALRATVVDGRLTLEAPRETIGMLDDVYEGVDDWSTQLNEWLSANGYRLQPLDVRRGQITLRKERVPQNGSGPPVA
jgi:hypothetical protein